MPSITLSVNGEEKIFTVPFIKARHYRKALEITKAVNLNNVSHTELDELVGFITDVFDNQFSVDEFYDGVSSSDLVGKIDYAIALAQGMSQEKYEKTIETIKAQQAQADQEKENEDTGKLQSTRH
ncbi:phage tail assembly chaperone G [Thalassobacillus sp. C254]|uniref:phage tail assembly chaperone G n=1 Tax=Thalassobacillus sp. C254 TaxID=1225341 RepID=UPI0006D149F9|nr:hypothetical protein [Thalassobacillus sp. C254]